MDLMLDNAIYAAFSIRNKHRRSETSTGITHGGDGGRGGHGVIA
jgi:hypothetical protein